MRESERNVGRADHNPSQRNDEQGERRTGDDSADRRAHGAHGRGTLGQEEKVDPTSPAPDSADGTDRGGSAGWGSEGSGGSTIDKSSPAR